MIGIEHAKNVEYECCGVCRVSQELSMLRNWSMNGVEYAEYDMN